MFFREGRLEVEDDVYALAVVQRPNGPAAQVIGDAAFQPVVGEIEIALLVHHFLTVDVERQSDVLHLQAGQAGIIVFGKQCRFTGKYGCNRMSRLFGQPVAVAGRSGDGIGLAARGDDHGIEIVQFGQTADAAAVADVHPQFPDPPLERAGYVARHQRGGIDALPLERDRGNAQLRFEEADQVFIGKGPEGVFQKTLVGVDVGREFFPGPAVGEVAPPLPGEIDLAAEPVVLVEQYDGLPAQRFSSPDGRHHAGGAAPHDRHPLTHQLLKYCRNSLRSTYRLSSISPVLLLL